MAGAVCGSGLLGVACCSSRPAEYFVLKLSGNMVMFQYELEGHNLLLACSSMYAKYATLVIEEIDP